MLAVQLESSVPGLIEHSQLQAALQLMILAESSPQHQELAAWLNSNQDEAQTHRIALLIRLTRSKHSTDAFLSAGLVPILTSLLESAQSEVQFLAVLAIGMTARDSQQLCDAIIAAGALPKLADLSGSDQPDLQRGAVLGFALIVQSQQDTGLIQVSHFMPACISMLMSDNLYEQGLAARAMEEVVQRRQQAQCDAVITAGALPLLVAKLQSPQTELQMRAATVLAFLASNSPDSQTAVAVSSCAIEALPAVAAMLQSDVSECATKRAALKLVTAWAERSQKIRDRIVSSGMVPILAASLSSDHPSLQDQAAEALSNIAAGSQANKDAIIASGALPLLVGLVVTGQRDGRSMAAETSGRLAHQYQTTGAAIIAAGALPVLVALISSEASSEDEHWLAAFAVARLATGSQGSQQAVIASGALPLVATILQSDQRRLQSHVLTALQHLAAGSKQNQAAMTAEGILPALVGLLGRNEPSLQTAATSVLRYMTGGCQVGRAALVQAGAAPALAAMLQSDNLGVVQSAAACIAQLARGSHHEREAIMASGALPMLATLSSSDQHTTQESARAAMVMTLFTPIKYVMTITYCGIALVNACVIVCMYHHASVSCKQHNTADQS